MPKKGQGTGKGTGGGTGGRGRRREVETVNLQWNNQTADGVVTDIAISPATLMTDCRIIEGVTRFVDANSCLFEEGFRIVGTTTDSDQNRAIYTYVRF
jgi:hypothetical protein